MKKLKVFKYSYFPARLPLFDTIVIYLLLDKLQVSQLVWGIVGTIVILWWFLSLLAIIFLQDITTIEELE